MLNAVEFLQQQVNALTSNPEYAQHRDLVSSQMRITAWLGRLRELSNTLNRMEPSSPHPAQSVPPQASASNASAVPTSTSAPPSSATARSSSSESSSSNVMLLRDPTGTPHALLVGPSGSYRTPELSQDMLRNVFNGGIGANNNLQGMLSGLSTLQNNINQAQQRRSIFVPRNTQPQGLRRHQNIFPAGQPQVLNQLNPANPPQDAAQQPDHTHAADATANDTQHQQQQAQLHPDPAGAAQQPAAAPNPVAQREGAAPAAQQPDRLGPILGHLWLAVRILGFLYLFAGRSLTAHLNSLVGTDSSPVSWRAWAQLLALLAVGGAVVMVRAGWWRDEWERVRRHWEGLVVLAPVEGPQAQGQPQGREGGQAQGEGGGGQQQQQQVEGGQQQQQQVPTTAQHQPNAAVQPQRQHPTPEQTAQRLIAQRNTAQAPNNNFLGLNAPTWLGERLRDVERAVALFLASLWPGVGERAVRAREEMEQREREEREQREREQREWEERRGLEGSGAQGAQGSEGVEAGEGGEGVATSSEEAKMEVGRAEGGQDTVGQGRAGEESVEGSGAAGAAESVGQ
ncbi:hypothetical protein LTS18_006222 [Coniosporium uncinatum]|uniref:Uncharacterized protein n=1 Tax=Coniosporium uncinatum TaxID=93489 RepID=A0ACC3DDG9_9PEZI|nr:hypothetical protein LTS18_006222 [Coniosporium uncinatum]